LKGKKAGESKAVNEDYNGVIVAHQMDNQGNTYSLSYKDNISEVETQLSGSSGL